MFRGLPPESETIFWQQNSKGGSKCGFKFPGRGAKQAEKKFRFLEFGPQTLYLLERYKKLDKLRQLPQNSEATFAN